MVLKTNPFAGLDRCRYYKVNIGKSGARMTRAPQEGGGGVETLLYILGFDKISPVIPVRGGIGDVIIIWIGGPGSSDRRIQHF